MEEEEGREVSAGRQDPSESPLLLVLLLARTASLLLWSCLCCWSPVPKPITMPAAESYASLSPPSRSADSGDQSLAFSPLVTAPSACQVPAASPLRSCADSAPVCMELMSLVTASFSGAVQLLTLLFARDD